MTPPLGLQSSRLVATLIIRSWLTNPPNAGGTTGSAPPLGAAPADPTISAAWFLRREHAGRSHVVEDQQRVRRGASRRAAFPHHVPRADAAANAGLRKPKARGW